MLVLDEPTNHLDLPAIEQLEEALAAYAGTLLLVTHDRRMLEAVAHHPPARGGRRAGHRALRLSRRLRPARRRSPTVSMPAQVSDDVVGEHHQVAQLRRCGRGCGRRSSASPLKPRSVNSASAGALLGDDLDDELRQARRRPPRPAPAAPAPGRARCPAGPARRPAAPRRRGRTSPGSGRTAT